MAIAGYKLKINGGGFIDHIIDVGNVLEYEITGLTSGFEYAIQVASYNEEAIDSLYSSPVYGTPYGPTLLVDVNGDVLVDGDGNAIITFQ